MTLTDAAARTEALDPAGSFIVQAPAGSGKTGLLTHRFLVLLGIVDAPEEILAITFTRKAAAEMRSRVLEALAAARQGETGTSDYERARFDAAARALARDRQQDWRILDYPSRLRIMTIDSLCAGLTRQMPWLSGFGAQPRVSEDPTPLYREAARATLACVDDAEAGWSGALAELLAHLDNDTAALERLLADMLPRRDQWLRHLAGVPGPQLLATVESAVARLQAEVLTELAARLPPEWPARLPALAASALSRLPAQDRLQPLGRWLDQHPDRLPPAEPAWLQAWVGLTDLLLTNQNQWRRTVNARNGFPAGAQGDDTRRRMIELLQACAGDDDLLERLQLVRILPGPEPVAAERAALQALLQALPLAAAQLALVFKARGEVDFTEFSRRAVAALGEPESPTDLALALDHRVAHLLVDEFQDTSFSQFELLGRLTAGWVPGDGRTLFAVGDPMQSIYRFRDAQVALFLKARDEGIGSVALAPLTLRTNFRASDALVDWFNRVFPRLFPRRDNPETGAVTYAPADAVLPARAGAAVSVHPLPGAEAETEIAAVLEILRRGEPGSVGILVRSRRHVAGLLPALLAEGLRPTAVEIEALGRRAVVSDLLALTRALLHPGDRIAWLAVLRAPWCGLGLSALWRLAGARPAGSLAAAIEAAAADPDLDQADRRRLARIGPVLAEARRAARREPLHRRVERAWLALGGPAACEQPGALEDGRLYLSLLRSLVAEAGGGEPGVADIERRLQALFARPAADADPDLQILTMHKSKGLEFDTVILPGLGRKPPAAETPLLSWAERAGYHAGDGLLMAAIARRGEEPPALNRYIRQIQRRQSANEDVRLLYVACTRARHRLHLLGHAPTDARGQPAAAAGSLLRILWPVVGERFASTPPTPPNAEPASPAAPAPLRRLPVDYALPAAPPSPPRPPERAAVAATADTDEPPYEWAGTGIRRVGTVVHRLLQAIAESGAADWNEQRVRDSGPLIDRLLRDAAVDAGQSGRARSRVQQALVNTLRDRTGRWILDPTHPAAECERRVSGRLDGRVVHAVLDRTLIDGEGRRWIIDYKSSDHRGADLEGFLLEQRQRYAAQLETYARLLAAEEPGRPISLMLYFPLLGRHVAWPFAPARPAGAD